MTTKSHVEHLVNALKTDESYRISWVVNIAMAYIDCERWYKERTGKKYLNRQDKHIIANEAAEYFLKLLGTDKKANRG